MTLAPWRSILTGALQRNRSLPYSRYVQLATVRPDGRPANRTVVFRGFLDDTNQLKFTTDARSEKAEQIAAHPWGELCWYFPNTREQFRLLGKLTLVGNKFSNKALLKARQLQWQEMSDDARSQFAWAAPGQPRSNDDFNPTIPDPAKPLPNFCLLLLDPIQVDHLILRGEPQNRYQYSLSTTNQTNPWSIQAVNP